ncbi:MAG: M23 family metallopeptidase [Pseudomonadota bacterium]
MIRTCALMCCCLALLNACGSDVEKSAGPAPFYDYGVSKGIGSTGSHIVSAGDTLADIARRYGLTISDLAAENGIASTTKVKTGMRLILPRPRTYQVKEGDTTRVVANMFEMSAADIARLNALDGPTPLRAGQTLNLSREKLNQLVQQTVQTPLVPPPAKPAPRQSAPPAAAPSALQSVPANKDFMTPVKGRVIAAFGMDAEGRQNDGVNIAAAVGTPVQASRAGQVAYAAGDIAGYGNMILIKHDNSYVTVYAHLGRIDVAKGDRVRQGDVLGTVGQTGAVSVPQLHFEIRRGKVTENPSRHVAFGL